MAPQRGKWLASPALIISTLIAAALLQAAPPPKLAPAIETYEVGRFQDAIDLFALLVDDPNLPAAERATARVYSGAAWLELGKPELARAQLILGLKADPNVRADPARFVPQLVSMLEEERAKMPQQRPPPPVEKKDPPPPIEAHAPPEPEQPSSRVAWWWLPGAGGVVLAGVGGVLLGMASQQWGLLNTSSDPNDVEAARAAMRNGPVNLYAGIAAVTVGALAVVASIVLFLRDSPPVAVVPLTNGGAVVTLQGAW